LNAEAASPLVLDTNVLLWTMDPKRRRPEWEELLRGRRPMLTFVTLGEYLHILRKRLSPESLVVMEERLATYRTIPGTKEVARKFAELRVRFHTQVQDNDLWTAACVLALDEPVELATADGDFDRIAAAFPLRVVRPPAALAGQSAPL
jgi:predicted nucleic acid-binding protein